MADAIQVVREDMQAQRHDPVVTVDADALRRVLAVASAAVEWDATRLSVVDPDALQYGECLMRHREKRETLKRAVRALTTTTEGEKHG